MPEVEPSGVEEAEWSSSCWSGGADQVGVHAGRDGMDRRAGMVGVEGRGQRLRDGDQRRCSPEDLTRSRATSGSRRSRVPVRNRVAAPEVPELGDPGHAQAAGGVPGGEVHHVDQGSGKERRPAARRDRVPPPGARHAAPTTPFWDEPRHLPGQRPSRPRRVPPPAASCGRSRSSRRLAAPMANPPPARAAR